MQDLVTLNTNDITLAHPITTSRIIAKAFCKRHDNVLQKITSLAMSGDVEFFNALKIKEVGYIDTKGEYRKEYALTRDQFTFIAMGFTGKKANKFKVKFIKAFNLMERELLVRSETRATGKAIRHSMTDSIRDNLEDNTNHKKFAYSNYSKLVYKKVLGMTVKKYKDANNLKVSDNVRNHMSIDQLNDVQALESKIASYIEAFKEVLSDKESYEKIKEMLSK